MKRLEGEIALVTGGAQGMGAAHARAIVANAGKVVIADLRDEVGEALADDLGDAARYTHLDVISEQGWAAAVGCAVTEFGGLNVLVNNAGIATFGPLGVYTHAQWDTIIGINLTGPFLGMTAARDALVTSAPASIITSPRRLVWSGRLRRTATRNRSGDCVG